MTDKERELRALHEEFIKRYDIIEEEYPVDIYNLDNFCRDESKKAKQTKSLFKWFQEELDKINKK